MSADTQTASRLQPILVTPDELPVYCPGPKAPLWSMHPRVFIELEKSGTAACPYCSATYQLKDQS